MKKVLVILSILMLSLVTFSQKSYYTEILTKKPYKVVRNQPFPFGDVVMKLTTGTSVKLIRLERIHYWLISCDGKKGYISEIFLVQTEEMKTIFKLESERLEKKKNEELKKYLLQKYGTKNGLRILNGDKWLGMTKSMLLDSWGEPESINRTVGSFGVHEQWVYDIRNVLIYIEDGILTTWQDEIN